MTLPHIRFLKFFAHLPDMQFIETGTYHGAGVRTALRAGFPKVQSVEAVKAFYDDCKKRFSSHPDVRIHFGASERVFPRIIRDMEGNATYWLDAHFQDEESEISALHCSLAEEVAAICRYRRGRDDVVLIDDLRLLVNQKAWMGHSVNIQDVIGSLVLSFPNHFACRLDGFVPRDILAIIPNHARRAVFSLRYPADGSVAVSDAVA